MAAVIIPYDPSDRWQAALLSAIALGETGGRKDAMWLGVGGVDLRACPRNSHGFPIWAGRHFPTGASHAAGVFQFEPATWERIASQYGLDFTIQADQYEGAWYLAQHDFYVRTKRNLRFALIAGSFQAVQAGLVATWQSAGGHSGYEGLAAALQDALK